MARTNEQLMVDYQRALKRIASFSIEDRAFSQDDYENMLMMMAIAQEALEPSVLEYSSEEKE